MNKMATKINGIELLSEVYQVSMKNIFSFGL